MKNVFLFSLFVLVISSGCREIGGRRIRGSGEIKTEARTVSSFNSVQVSGAIDVYIKQDSVSSVKVVADDNLMEYIEVETRGSTLEIHTRRGVNIRTTDKIKVYVSNPSYKELEASGASSIRGENKIISTEALFVGLSGASDGRLDIDAPKVSIEVSGASNVTMRGKTKDIEADASGASKIKCFDLLAENVNVESTGASHAEVYASVKIIPHASGASSVLYKGNAVVEDKKESGASNVRKAD
jgi:Putative auto-transporter adhesin, head GIN domain